ncbi:MAG: peptide-methionine (S)-S-oxide reductase MsrA [Pseudomonadota bacterium]|nr:peptide-methionine (S)-S-oxide reductase MsrA [Pseudomonadota bacterium]
MNTANAQTQLETATLGGGCFWCMEKPYEALKGVESVVSGYTGGHTPNPTYKDVSSGQSGHVEVVQVTFDPQIISYEEILKNFWVNIDPEVKNRQFCDVGPQYRSIIYYHSEDQKKVAEQTKHMVENSGLKVATEIAPAVTFYPAEDYHQNYYKKNPIRYKYYRYACGRDSRLDDLWGENRQFPTLNQAIKEK